LIPVQHHHAHIAAVMAEHGLTEPVIGFSFDGTGYGPDRTVWGGEVLLADYANFRRAAHLDYVSLPGGDSAVKRPYKIALAYLWAAGVPWDEMLPPVAVCPAVERRVIKHQLETGFNAVPTSSMGRLFDAVAALVGIRQTVTYEAQAAIELEAIAAAGVEDSYAFSYASTNPIQIQVAPVIQDIVADLRLGLPAALIAAKFHQAVADLILQLGLRLREQTGLNQVALSGGVFQNVTLLQAAVQRLQAAGFAVFTPRLVPPNDGGLALGQAMIAAAQSNLRR
jgi:hydrogenase maturation protein HypF